MEKKKQSSIEWLQATELERDLTLADWNKAKAMHKEEIKKSYTTGFGANLHQAEQYYNETFGGDK